MAVQRGEGEIRLLERIFQNPSFRTNSSPSVPLVPDPEFQTTLNSMSLADRVDARKGQTPEGILPEVASRIQQLTPKDELIGRTTGLFPVFDLNDHQHTQPKTKNNS